MQNRFEEMIMAVLVLLVGTLSVCAQEPVQVQGRVGPGRMSVVGFAEGSMNKVVKGAPYSAEAVTETDQTLVDGNEIRRQTTANVYRDSQGRTRREETMGDMGPWSTTQPNTRQIIWINDPVAGVRYMLNPDEQVALKFAEPNTSSTSGGKRTALASSAQDQGNEPILAPPPSPDALPDVATVRAGANGPEVSQSKVFFFQTYDGEADNPGAVESLGTETLEGLQVTGKRITFTIPAGKIGNELPINVVTERWYSPALQMVIMSKRSDPRVGVTTYRLTNISLGEPSPDLFQVPPGYTVKNAPVKLGPENLQFPDKLKPGANQ